MSSRSSLSCQRRGRPGAKSWSLPCSSPPTSCIRSSRMCAKSARKFQPTIWTCQRSCGARRKRPEALNSVRRGESRVAPSLFRSEEHTSELQSHSDLVCRLLLEKKKIRIRAQPYHQVDG